MPPASEFMMPELAATATFRPCRWKKRITSAVVRDGAADQAGEVVGELLGEHRLERQRRATGAHERDRARERRSERDDERDGDPSPLRVRERGRPVDARELADDEVDAEDRARGHGDVGPRHPPQLDRLGELGPRQLPRPLPAAPSPASSRLRVRWRVAFVSAAGSTIGRMSASPSAAEARVPRRRVLARCRPARPS